MANIFLGNLNNFNDKYKVRIVGYNTRNRIEVDVLGYSLSDFAVSGGNQYESFSNAIDNLASGALGQTVGSVVSKARSGIKSIETISTIIGGQSQFTSPEETRATWSGSNLPSFQLELQFLCLDSENPSEDVVTKVNSLMRAVYPDIGKANTLNVNIFKAPLGYSSKDNNNGKFTISIGKWFQGTKMVIENISFTYGKELNRNGKPIYANGAITFRPYKMISYKQFVSYFRNIQE